MLLSWTISEVARRTGVAPRALSDLFYQRVLSDETCPVVGGRRLIPASYLPVIDAALRTRGLLGAESCGRETSTESGGPPVRPAGSP
jgi:hypothetical protein